MAAAAWRGAATGRSMRRRWIPSAPREGPAVPWMIGDGAAAVVARSSDGLGGGDDMVKTKLADTKVLGARVLPVLGRRL